MLHMQLRQRAESAYLECAVDSMKDQDKPDHVATKKIVHELHVHQIELEMQNEELRRTGIELEESRARYFDLYDLAPEGYCTVNDHGLILEANLAAAQVLGTSRSALVSQSLSQFVFNADQNAYYSWRKQVVQSGQPHSCELRLVSSSETPRWMLLNATATRFVDEKLVLHVVLSDVTERKNTEAALQEAQQRLRNFTLRQQEEFDELRCELARDVHDQLGQTLAAMKLEIDLISDLAPSAASQMRRLIKEGVSSVRDISRALRPVALDLGLTHALRTMATELSMRSDVDITTWLPESLPNLPGQTERALYRIAQEALSNSVTHAQAHKIDISLHIRHDHLALTVSDDGQGFTLNGPSVQRGLGLLGMRERARQLGANISIQSTPGKGTLIQVYLPNAAPGSCLACIQEKN